MLWLLACSGPLVAADVPVIAAASDLQFALTEIGQRFTEQSGKSIRLSFGSSGNFRRQITEGAPFELFLSADEGLVAELARDGKTLDEGRLYAIGRLVIIVPHGSRLRPDGALEDLAAGISDGRVKKFAIASPEHAPYGRAARETLIHAGLWDKLQDKLVMGENVSQAAQFATSGSAQGGIVAYSLVLSPAVGKLADYALLPAAWHQPLRQRVVLLKNAGDTAKMFYRFLQEPTARSVFKKYGFVLPGE